MNRFNINNNHRLGLKSTVSKIHQTEIIKKENDELLLESIYPKEQEVITHNEIKETKININIPNLAKTTTQPKMKAVVVNAYQKFLKKEFKY